MVQPLDCLPTTLPAERVAPPGRASRSSRLSESLRLGGCRICRMEERPVNAGGLVSIGAGSLPARTSPEDIHFSRARFAPPLPLGASTGGASKLAWTVFGVAMTLAVGGAALILGTRWFGTRNVAPEASGAVPENRPASV